VDLLEAVSGDKVCSVLLVMPQIISNKDSRQQHPIYPNKNKDTSMSTKKRSDSPEKTTAIPKTYDAIKNAAGGEMAKPKGK
jgi:hypothetical protein